MPKPPIPQLGEPSTTPDQYTKKAPEMTGREAEGRVLFIDLGFFKYGTDDKTHAGSIILSLALLAIMAIIAIGGLFSGNMDVVKVGLSTFGPMFTFVAGVAIGRGSSIAKKKRQKGNDGA